MPLKGKLKTGEFTVIAELYPPKGTDYAKTLESAQNAADAVDLFCLTDMTGGIMRMSPLGLIPHMKERKVFVDVEHPVMDKTVLYNWPWKISGVACRMQRAPLFGEHSEYVFGEILGFSREEIESLMEQEVIY